MSRHVTSRKLTPKRLRFVEEYPVDFNASAAYKRAGYAVKSDKVAQVEGHRLLVNPSVQAAIAVEMEKTAHRTHITQDMVLTGLANIAGLDLAEVIGEDGRLVNIHQMKEAVRRSLAGIETVEIMVGSGDDAVPAQIRKVKLADRVRALELLGKHLAMFTDKVDVTLPTWLVE